MKHLISKLITVALLAVGLTAVGVVTATPSQAYTCGYAWGYAVRITGHGFRHAWSDGGYSSVSGDPGVTLQIAKGRDFGVSGSITTTASVSAGVIFAKVSTAVGVTVGGSYNRSNQISGSWTVPHTYKYRHGGTLEIGAIHYYGYIRRWHETGATCTRTWARVGRFNAATQQFYFHHSPIVFQASRDVAAAAMRSITNG
ncbi:hypothetical protein [Nocardioides montaniterrae]